MSVAHSSTWLSPSTFIVVFLSPAGLLAEGELLRRGLCGRGSLQSGRMVGFLAEPAADSVEVVVDHRGREQRQHLRDQQAAADRPAERLAELRAGAMAEDHRHPAQEG